MYQFVADFATWLAIYGLAMLLAGIGVDWMFFRAIAKRFDTDTAWEAMLKANSGNITPRNAIFAAAVILLLLGATGLGASAMMGAFLGFLLSIWLAAPLYRWRHRAYLARNSKPDESGEE